MIKVKTKSLNFLLPPTLVAVFPILSFYLNNISELSLKFVGKPVLYSITTAIITTLILFALVKNKNKASLIVSLSLLIFFSYGHLSRSLNSRLFIQLPSGMVLGPDKILLPIVLALFVFPVIKILRSTKTLTKTIAFASVSLLVLITYQILAIAKTEYQKKGNQLTQPDQLQGENQIARQNTPDIYYIILDGYARQDVLKEVYNYDNSEFISKLKKIGFYVANSARSNYIHTYLSLPSSLNMRYLDELPQKYGTDPVDGSAARQLVINNQVAEKLKANGYRIINFASSWEGTNESYSADITYRGDDYFKIFGKNIALDESSITFLQTTLLSPLIKQVWGDALRSRTLATLQKLPTIPYQEGKKFTLAHIMAPHPPYVFTSDGSPVPNAELEMADEGIDKRPKYLDQLVFISNQIVPVIEKIIQNSPKPPIIILQSDHGPGSIFGKREDWLKNYSPEGVKERSSILYAIYFPNQNYQDFYQTITPVNTFRILFNNYFGENLELLPDKTFYTSYEAIYNFKDVTETE
ncbi:MAG: sulfatase-like hydrolase/transferase [Patescibacteria group bacterium]